MKWIVGSLMAAMIAAPAMAMQPAVPPAGPVAHGVRACVDARGLDADCGVDPPEMHECYASDRFGRCPGDPTCFDAEGFQARCTWPVVRRDGPCFSGQVVSPARCRRVAGVSQRPATALRLGRIVPHSVVCSMRITPGARQTSPPVHDNLICG